MLQSGCGRAWYQTKRCIPAKTTSDSNAQNCEKVGAFGDDAAALAIELRSGGGAKHSPFHHREVENETSWQSRVF